MPIEFYTGRPEFATTHEMIVRDQLIFALTQCFSNTPTLVAAVFDFSCGEDLDFALFKSDAIIVVEFKDCGSAITGGENGSWRIVGKDNAELSGGRHGNPYQQVRKYRYALMRYLSDKSRRFLTEQKAVQTSFEHIAAVVCVSPDLNPNSDLEFDFGRLRWFDVVGLPTLPRKLYNLRSSRISLSDHEIRTLVEDVLRCDPMVIQGPNNPSEPLHIPSMPTGHPTTDFTDFVVLPEGEIKKAIIYEWYEGTVEYDQCQMCGRLLCEPYCPDCKTHHTMKVSCIDCLFCDRYFPETEFLDHLIERHSDLEPTDAQ